MNEEEPLVVLDEIATLEKFEGEAVPENCIERIVIQNGVITEHQFLENGIVVRTEKVEEVE